MRRALLALLLLLAACSSSTGPRRPQLCQVTRPTPFVTAGGDTIYVLAPRAVPCDSLAWRPA